MVGFVHAEIASIRAQSQRTDTPLACLAGKHLSQGIKWFIQLSEG